MKKWTGWALVELIVLVAIMAGFFLPAVVQAADREVFTVTELHVQRIKKLGSGDAIDVQDKVAFGESIDVEEGAALTVQTAANATNNAALTLTTGIHRFSAIGSANNGTNTVTLTRPTDAQCGEVMYIINTGTTNNLLIAASGAWNSPAKFVEEGAVVVLFGVEDADGTGTNAWYGF